VWSKGVVPVWVKVENFASMPNLRLPTMEAGVVLKFPVFLVVLASFSWKAARLEPFFFSQTNFPPRKFL